MNRRAVHVSDHTASYSSADKPAAAVTLSAAPWEDAGPIHSQNMVYAMEAVENDRGATVLVARGIPRAKAQELIRAARKELGL